MVVRVRRRPAVVDIPGFRVALSNVSHGYILTGRAGARGAGPSLLTVAFGFADCLTLVSNDRQHPGYPAGVLASRLARRAADPTAGTSPRPRPAPAWQHRRAGRPRT